MRNRKSAPSPRRGRCPRKNPPGRPVCGLRHEAHRPISSPSPWASPAAAEETWIPFFNGKNLDGWTPKITGCKLGENFNDTFRVEDGVLKVELRQIHRSSTGKFGHLFYKTPFQSYRFRAEYRFVGEQCPGGPAGPPATAA